MNAQASSTNCVSAKVRVNAQASSTACVSAKVRVTCRKYSLSGVRGTGFLERKVTALEVA